MTDSLDQGQHRADGGDDDSFKPLSAEQARLLRAQWPKFSLWTLVLVQLLTGLVLAAMVWAWTMRLDWMWSVLYGAAASVVPQAVVAYGASRSSASAHRGAGGAGFFIWEFAKVLIALLMLLMAPWWVERLSWPAMLVAMVVCVKMNWWVLFRQGSARTKS